MILCNVCVVYLAAIDKQKVGVVSAVSLQMLHIALCMSRNHKAPDNVISHQHEICKTCK